MSTINKYNYEAVLLDFAEGRLSAKETNDLFDFLAAHPELQEDFDAALEIISLEDAADVSFSKKMDLLQDETLDFQQTLIIANLEGVANQDETQQLEVLKKDHPRVEKEIAIFSKLKMEADEQLVFSRKEALMQENTVRFSAWLYRTTYAAAAVLLLFILVNALSPSQTGDFTELAQSKLNQLNQNIAKDDNQNKAVDNPTPQLDEPFYAEKTAPGQGQSNATKQRTVPAIVVPNDNNLAANDTKNREIIETFELLPIREASALEHQNKVQLAVFSAPELEPTKSEKEQKFNSGLLNYLAEQSPRIESTYGFAGEVSDKLKSFTGDFQNVDEIELKFWGMRTTIRKPSWMKWRRQNVKSE